jgi:hypothetical protein
MSLKKLALSQLEEFILPEEVWILIWSHLDFKIFQKICTRVSKSWFEKIRNSKLSWEMKLKCKIGHRDAFGVTDFNTILSHWNELRVIHFSTETDLKKISINFEFSQIFTKNCDSVWARSLGAK